MAFEWSEYAFGELCTITRGASPRPINAFLSKTGMPWIKIADATSSDSRFLETTNECIKLEGVKSSVRVFPGDLILSNSATPGLPKFVMIEACIHDGWMLLRKFKGLDKNFAYWLLINERKTLIAQGNGSVFTNLKTDILKLHRVRIPDLATQFKIAQILDPIAVKIDLNRRINQTLEAMAQAIFKSWFVDFDPVKARISAIKQGEDPLRAAMRVISGKTDAELDQMPREHHDQLAATAALFPDAMEESELGEIPKGWKVSTIGETVEIAGGATPDTKNESYWNPPEHFWTSPKDLSGVQSPVLLTTERKVSTAGLSRIGSGLLPKGTLLISSRAPIGYLAITQVPVAINQGYIAMLPGGKLPPLYLLMWCQQNMEEIKGQANGSTFMEISKKAFRPMLIINPGSILLDRFLGVVAPLFGKLVEGVKESSQLAELRDTLLPKLLSGELSVADLDKEAALS
ncbi:type I restriction enzyme, S subunit [Lampropedia hyalina DSM 16112]|jgi:type I restriction enzyme S subunit|uniref:Type I restriction enzyme, S subunit n=1 Tax=Lampropedia hyalina DSM 16112 TaxID=1122156 RepID=A0A1M4SB90_9BURK|nr:restriction endonuclease subunit S [Lampropedia hyalina]SHE29405.1 type I restriction enzyme, S subunit [Lampropedia hyalina DSM 16112]